METAQLTIKLPKTELIFLERYTQRHRISISELFDAYIRQLQQVEQEPDQRLLKANVEPQNPVEAFLDQWTGILKGTDPHELKWQYLQEKYQ